LACQSIEGHFLSFLACQWIEHTNWHSGAASFGFSQAASSLGLATDGKAGAASFLLFWLAAD